MLAGCRAASKALFVALACCGCSPLAQRSAAQAEYPAAGQWMVDPPGEVEPARFEQPEPADPLTLADFSPENFTRTVKRLAGQGPAPELARELYAEADAHYGQAVAARERGSQDAPQLFLAAAESFAAAAARWPDSSLEHEALFRLGECYFFADRYPDAEEAYEAILKKHPHSKFMDRIQPLRFSIARYWLAEAEGQSFYEVNVTDTSRPSLDNFGHAVRVLDRIRLDDPTGKLADDATLALGNAFFRRAKYLRADEYYTDLRKTFPSSEHQFSAHFLGMQAKLMSYQGADYSANALNEADKLLTQIRRQFPVEAEREREYLTRAQARVRFYLAEREWVLAEHYYRRRELGAARFYYQALVNKYPGTPFAERSEQRMRESDGLPDNPPQRLSWLVDLFPAQESVEPLMATSSMTTERR